MNQLRPVAQAAEDQPLLHERRTSTNMGVTDTGEWRLASGEVIGPSTTPVLLDTMAVRGTGRVHVRPGGSVFTVHTEVEGRAAFLSAAFDDGRLETIEIVLLTGDTLAQSDQERLKQEHEAWLQSLGFDLRPLAYSVDGVDILPAEIGPAHPRRDVLPWGEVTSLIDSRNGGASIVVRYGRVAPGTH